MKVYAILYKTFLTILGVFNVKVDYFFTQKPFSFPITYLSKKGDTMQKVKDLAISIAYIIGLILLTKFIILFVK